MLVGDLAERDGEIAREPRFGRQGVVMRQVQPSIGDAEPDREELTLPVEQKAELGLFDQVVGESAEAHDARSISSSAAALDRSIDARRSPAPLDLLERRATASVDHSTSPAKLGTPEGAATP